MNINDAATLYGYSPLSLYGLVKAKKIKGEAKRVGDTIEGHVCETSLRAHKDVAEKNRRQSREFRRNSWAYRDRQYEVRRRIYNEH